VWYLLPQTTRRSGERRELPQRIWRILSITEHFWLQDIVSHENKDEVQYALKMGSRLEHWLQ